MTDHPFVCSSIPPGKASWRDGEIVHACQGERMHTHDPSTFLVWTLCGKDVPAGQAQVIKGGFGGFIAAEEITCATCREAAA